MDKRDREKQKTETKRVSIWKVILNFLELEISYQKETIFKHTCFYMNYLHCS